MNSATTNIKEPTIGKPDAVRDSRRRNILISGRINERKIFIAQIRPPKPSRKYATSNMALNVA
jgi:hypothetical protein